METTGKLLKSPSFVRMWVLMMATSNNWVFCNVIPCTLVPIELQCHFPEDQNLHCLLLNATSVPISHSLHTMHLILDRGLPLLVFLVVTFEKTSPLQILL
jgi:hypothetical protein